MPVDQLLRHFGLTLMPFARPVPAGGLLQHKSFDEALTRLSLAVESKSAAVLTAEPGLGKSTLLGTFADRLDKGRTRLVYTALCSCGPFGLIGQLAGRYGVKNRRSSAQTAQAILDELAKSDRDEILMLDEGHRLPHASLDELRLLSNLDFDRTPPFALILAGQPPLRDAAADKVFERTRGVLRLINNLATSALLAAAAGGKKHVDVREVEDAVFDQEST